MQEVSNIHFLNNINFILIILIVCSALYNANGNQLCLLGYVQKLTWRTIHQRLIMCEATFQLNTYTEYVNANER